MKNEQRTPYSPSNTKYPRIESSPNLQSLLVDIDDSVNAALPSEVLCSTRLRQKGISSVNDNAWARSCNIDVINLLNNRYTRWNFAICPPNRPTVPSRIFKPFRPQGCRVSAATNPLRLPTSTSNGSFSAGASSRCPFFCPNENSLEAPFTGKDRKTRRLNFTATHTIVEINS
jgi:hypothetical protein